MSKLHLANPPQLQHAAGFSHVATGGGLIWLTAQVGTDESGRLLHPGDIAAQVGQSLRNVATALAGVGAEPHNVVQITYYLTDMAAYNAAFRNIESAHREIFGSHDPATTILEVKGLVDPEAMVAIDCVAVAQNGKGAGGV